MSNKFKGKIVCIIIILAVTGLGFSGQALTSIKIDTAQTGNKISPQLFGHNLEHTRRAIWRGISAEMVANRKFAATDCGLPMRWHTLSGEGVSLDKEAPFVGKHSVRLDNTGAGDVGIWQQHDWLTFAKGRKYAFRIWVRANQKQDLRLQIISRSGFHAVFTGQKLFQAKNWQLWSGEFESPKLAKGTQIRLVAVRPGTTWIGAVSLMPADNFHGMRRDVVELFKQLKPGNLRWPGGCFAEYYNWKDGLLPVDKRPPIGPHQWVGLLPDSDGFDNHEIGIDEFIALCRELDCDPHITTRYGGEGSIEETAAWVEYCNGSEDTHWGSVRAKRGHKKPYGVKYWYVGNEIAGMSLVKNKDPRACAATSRAYAEAMKKVDSNIILNSGAPASEEWLKPQLEKSGDLFDMVQIGFYFQPHERYVVDADRIVKTPSAILQGLKSKRQVIDRMNPNKKRLDITYYEWNVMWDREGDVLSGIFAAEMLNMFCREAEGLGLTIASYFQPITEGAIKVGPIKSQLEPDGQVFALYSVHQGNRLLIVPDISDKQIDLCASLTPDGKSIFVTIINQNTTSDCTLELSLTNFTNLDNASAELLVPQTLEVGGKFALRRKILKIINGNKVELLTFEKVKERACISR